jgi:hypothetical protein
MKATLAMLAVTVMKTGVCIAGVRPGSPGTWVRPVREFGSVLLGDITYPASHPPPAGSPSASAPRRVMRPFDLVELTLSRARPNPPHIEDFACDFAHARPRLIATVPEPERAALLDAAAATPDAIFVRGSRSLGTLALDDLTASFTHDGYTGGYETRLAFAGLPPGVASVPCTDLKWRALGRQLLAERGQIGPGAEPRTLTLAGDELRSALGSADRWWVVLGVGRFYQGRHWPLIVGVHTLPDYATEVDYATL